jgi:hypothetical protein
MQEEAERKLLATVASEASSCCGSVRSGDVLLGVEPMDIAAGAIKVGGRVGAALIQATVDVAAVATCCIVGSADQMPCFGQSAWWAVERAAALSHRHTTTL